MFSRLQPAETSARGRRGRWLLLLCAGCLVCDPQGSRAADLEEAQREFVSGRYDRCIAMAEQALKAKGDAEEWGTLLTEALITRGRYPQALAAVTNALAGEPRSIRLRWAAHQALLFNNQAEAATNFTTEILRLFSTRTWAYRDPKDLVVFGRVALLGGMDPKTLLDRLYDPVKKASPKQAEAYLASGELALEKHDFALAAKFFQEGLAQLPEHPDLHFGLARAFAPSDQKQMLASLTEALERNTNHLGSLLLLADHGIDAEDYVGAEQFLDRVQAVNAWHPEAWAYRAVIAHLRNQADAEQQARSKALKFWPANPRVDYLIGLKLSQKYRFAAGANHQRTALAFAPDYLPAKGQLAQDLLRLGQEAEGWRLADEVQREDGYDVSANNLVTLQGVIARFQTLTNEHFLVRLEPREATLYGQRALELLEEARTRVCPKYGMTFSEPVLIELFNQEKDFAVRTFGMPDNDGFLGVCFGKVITANSPGSRAGRSFNWESMLWHEFCHVVTLQLTGNKMPRWLSEGISVYEERQANPAWGERLNPRYRELLLGSELTPLSKLSGAFLAPKSAVHLQFAYFEASLVVQFLVERFGRDCLVTILKELGAGAEINESLAKHTVPMSQLEPDFESYARRLGRDMAPGLDWEKPTSEVFEGLARVRPGQRERAPPLPGEMTDSAWELWGRTHPTNYWVMSREAGRLIEARQWATARPLLEKLIELYPDATGSDSAYPQLAAAYRGLGETNAERQILRRFAAKDDEATDAYQRLMELASQAGDWPEVATNANRYRAVNPLVALPYRFLARASEATGQTGTAIEAYRALLQLDPSNPAEAHFHLAKLLRDRRDPEARRQVLQALEEAPRYREALRLLRQMRTEDTNTLSQTTAALQPAR